MTTVTIYKTVNQEYRGFTCFGHAGYARRFQKDILCAGISALVINTLNSMEEKGLIFRKRSEKDKRQVFVSINMENAEVYERQHKNVLNFVDQVLEKVRNDKAEEIIQLFTLISNR